MCGICGFTGSRVSKKLVLSKMMNKIIHRGPDSAGEYIDDEISMGFRRLSIIDIDNGSQPMQDEGGEWVISFNGEIYNYKELREDLILCGYSFNTDSDTEVLLKGFIEYRQEILDKLRGMFAFVVWNKKERKLFAARDGFGIKPFYYSIINDELIYASEIKSILEYPEYTKEVNEEALAQYLAFQYSVLEETFFKNIYKLPAGHFMTFENNNLSVAKYFSPMLEPEENNEDILDEIDEVLKDSISHHMISDVEVGSLLSSGVDSSYVASNFSGKKTFTVGFDYEKYNEIPYAKALSKRLGKENYSRIISTEEYWEELPRIQYMMDEPLADPAAVALYFVDREAAKEVKVVLSGEGADELFGGYNIYKEPLALKNYQKLPKAFRKAVGRLMSGINVNIKGKNFLIRGSKTVEERFIGNARIFNNRQRELILKKRPKLSPKQITRPYYNEVANLDDISKMQYIDINFWLVGDILLKADKMSMAHSLESRVPFLDKEVYRVASKLPLAEKVSSENTKLAFRKVAGRYLNKEEANKKKLGFPVPIRIWLREEKYYERVKKLFESEMAENFFNTAEIIKLLDEHRLEKMDNSRQIWTIYIFLLWYREYFVA